MLAGFALGGLVSVLLAEDRAEEGLFLKGMAYAFLGNFLINIGSIPIPATQIIGFVMASLADRNAKSRFAAWGIGLAMWVVPWLFFRA